MQQEHFKLYNALIAPRIGVYTNHINGYSLVEEKDTHLD